MREFYIFKYKRTFFVLLVGETIILSGWHKKISQTVHKIINKIRISNKLKNLLNNKPGLTPAHMGLRDSAALTNPDNPEGCQRFVKGSVEICFSFDLKDHTYSEAKNPRRLRSLGGGLRRLLSNLKKNDKSLTNKKIIENLAYLTLYGDDKKLVTQISAVENNTKFNSQIETKDKNSNYLPPVQYIVQKYKEGNPDEIKKLIRQLEYWQKEIIQEQKEIIQELKKISEPELVDKNGVF